MGPRGSVRAHIKTARSHTTPRKLFRRLLGLKDLTENTKNQETHKIDDAYIASSHRRRRCDDIGGLGGSFAWDSEACTVLQDINFEVYRGELVGVVGEVGSCMGVSTGGCPSFAWAYLNKKWQVSNLLCLSGNWVLVY